MLQFKIILLVVTLAVTVSAYKPPKKPVLPPNPDKYDTVESIAAKDDYKKDDIKGQDDVLYVKGQPVVEGKEELAEEAYGGKYGDSEKKITEIKAEESGLDLGPVGGYGKPVKGHGKKAYGDVSYTKEVKEVKYDAIEDKGKFGFDEDKVELVKEDNKFGGVDFGKEFKKEKKYGGGGYGGGGYGGGKKEIIKEEVIKEDVGYGVAPKKDIEGKQETVVGDGANEEFLHGWVGGYLPEAPSGGYGPVVPSPKESYGGFGGEEFGKQGGKKDGYEVEEKYEETVKDIGGQGKPLGGPKGGFGEGKFAKEETVIGGYGIKKGSKGGYGVGPIEPKDGFVEEKIEETIKEGGEYGGGKKAYEPKGGFAEEKIEETIKEGGYDDVKPKGGYGYEKEIKTTKYGGGFKDEKQFGGDFGSEYGPKPGKPITTMSTAGCNKMIDGLLGKLQHSFTSHMSSYKVENVSPVPLGGWARVRMYDGKFDKIGQICRGGDFQVLPQGENIVIRGTIVVPEPRVKYCGDAYLYNRLKVRNRNLALCAKDASFRVQMMINKRLGKIDVDQLEPVSINGFHIEDDKGLRSGALAWPFNKIHDNQLGKQKYQFMSQLQHKLCDDFRQIVAKPEITEEIVQLV